MLSLLLGYTCILKQKISPAVSVHLYRYTCETLLLGYIYTDTHVKPCCWGTSKQIQMSSLLLGYTCILKQKLSPAVRVILSEHLSLEVTHVTCVV